MMTWRRFFLKSECDGPSKTLIADHASQRPILVSSPGEAESVDKSLRNGAPKSFQEVWILTFSCLPSSKISRPPNDDPGGCCYRKMFFNRSLCDSSWCEENVPCLWWFGLGSFSLIRSICLCWNCLSYICTEMESRMWRIQSCGNTRPFPNPFGVGPLKESPTQIHVIGFFEENSHLNP